MKVIYEGVNIYPKISVSRCLYECFAGGHADELTLRLNDTRKLWDIWQPKRGDEIQVELSTVRTGKMYVHTVKPENGTYTIRAFSVPLSMWQKRNKSWERVRLTQICSEIAERNGLELRYFGVSEQLYTYVEQSNQSDAEFFSERLAVESASWLVYDGKLIVYSEPYMESQSPLQTISINAANDFRFSDDGDSTYGTCEVVNGQYTGRFNIGDGSIRRLVLPVTLTDQHEADRFAKGMLRLANKRKRTCELETGSLMKQFSAGSTVNLECGYAPSFNGPAFIDRIRFDLFAETTHIVFRKPLEGY